MIHHLHTGFTRTEAGSHVGYILKTTWLVVREVLAALRSSTAQSVWGQHHFKLQEQMFLKNIFLDVTQLKVLQYVHAFLSLQHESGFACPRTFGLYSEKCEYLM